MNKGELIKELAERNNITQQLAGDVLNSFIDIVTSLNEEDKVRIKNFGTFEMKIRKERNGTNPRTKENIVIPEIRSIGFNPSKTLKEKKQ